MKAPDLLEISREIAALAQTGLAFTRDPFDRERFERLRELAGEMLHVPPDAPAFVWPAESGYATPKVDVRAIVFRDREVLLVREASSGLWTVPGGWADVNLSAAENAEKECREESGFLVKAVRLTSVIDRERAGYPRNAHSIYKIFFLCELQGGAASTSIESTEVGFFPLSALPPLDLHRVRQADIDLAWLLHEDPSRPAEFN